MIVGRNRDVQQPPSGIGWRRWLGFSGGCAVGGAKELAWVRNVNGQPRVRWGRVAVVMLALIGGTLSARAIWGQYAYTPEAVLSAALPTAAFSAYLVLLVELQSQRVRTGKWSFAFSIRAVLLWTAIASILLALTMSAVRHRQRGLAESQRIKGELEAVIDGGQVFCSMLWGEDIFCHVTRPTFSDKDLAAVIRLASHGDTVPCELTLLTLSVTSVTNDGVCQLAACRKLTLLALPALDLSPEAISALANCSRLEYLYIDERPLTERQIDQLRKALPSVRLNNKSWAQRPRKTPSPAVAPVNRSFQ